MSDNVDTAAPGTYVVTALITVTAASYEAACDKVEFLDRTIRAIQNVEIVEVVAK